MSSKRFSKLLLVVLALALWAGTANAQLTATPTTATFAYTKGGVSNTASQTSAISDAVDGTAYTVTSTDYSVNSSTNAWLATPTSTGSWTANTVGTGADTLAFTLTTATVNLMGAGTYTATVTLGETSTPANTATIVVTLNVTSPLAATTPASLALTFVKTGGGSQTAGTTTSTVSNTDGAAYDSYTIVPSVNCPTWLDTTSANSPGHADAAESGHNDTLTFSIDATNGAAASVQNITTCSVALQFNGATFKTVTFTSLAIVAQPLVLTAPTASLYWNKGSQSGTQATSVTVKVAAGSPSTLFNLDISTLPPWLSVTSGLTNNAANATVGGDTVTFGLVTGVAGGMPTGNYSQMVGFYAGAYADVYATISLQVANATPSLTELPSSETFISQTASMALPTPTAALYSTDEPVPFTATCTVAHTATYTPTASYLVPCSLNGAAGNLLSTGNVVNGTAFTWGYSMTATLDPVLFQATIGNTVTVTFTFTGVSSPPAPIVYQYTLQPGIPTITAVGPTSASANFSHSNSLVVLVKGTNFIGPGSISGSSIVPTQVWLGTPAVLLTAANASTAGSYVVLNSTQMMVTIPGSAFPTVAAGHTGTIAIGVANQTGASTPTAATATGTLNITNNPVIYAITSTASYIQPAIGNNPAFAPYELISIFGDNFGLTGSTTASAAFDAFGKVVSPMVLTAAVGHTAATTLAVTFVSGHTTLTAPVLFSNQNQINAIVPSGVVAGTNYTVTVAAAGLSSDGLFTVGTVAADPAIFTLASDGTGQGAIINQDGSINGGGHAAPVNTTVSIYLTGLGTPDSTGVDVAGTTATNFPNTCVAISNTTANTPGLMQVVNTKVTGNNAYTAPTPAWTTIDGATMMYGAHDIILGNAGYLNFPPCMATATIAVTFGPAANQVVGTVTYAGFVSGSVAGLYQINVSIPASLVGTGGTTLAATGAQPVNVSITTTTPATFNSQSGVTMIF